MKHNPLTPRTKVMALLLALFTITICFAGWVARADRSPFNVKSLTKQLSSPTAPDAPPANPMRRLEAFLNQSAGQTYTPTQGPISTFTPVRMQDVATMTAIPAQGKDITAAQEPVPGDSLTLESVAGQTEDETRPRTRPKSFENRGTPINGSPSSAVEQARPEALLPSPTGTSPGPSKSFKGEFLSGTTIPPDTMGAVGPNHVVNVTNDRMRIQTREGVELSRVTLNTFWAGVTIKGAAVSSFDPKILFDRFNNRWILVSTFNAASVSSGVGFAVSQTSDPMGTWNRYTAESDPASTAAGGRWIDYPSIGLDKDKIVVMYNVFNYGTAGSGYYGPYIYVLDKMAAYNGTLAAFSLFQDSLANCTAPFEGKLGCGFTMNPSIVEDNTTTTNYLIEDWDSRNGQLRTSKITGTAAAPVLTVGTQFPQSTHSWRFNAARISTSGGYAPQRQQSAHLPSGTRIMANDARIQNAVLRNGTLWTTHTVMVAATPTAAGTTVGGSANPDIRSAVQWWQINPTIETGLSAPEAVLQRARIEDPTADNCHNGSAGTRTTGPCTSTALQVGTFFAFPNISVNKNNDVLIGFTQFSAVTYPSAAYAMRLGADPVNTTRDPVVFRPGQANYNIGSGSGTARQNRWGDYSAAQTDPLNDTDFWTVQEYAGTYRDFGIGLAGPWETWWAKVSPSTPAPSKTGDLIISEFRLRGPQGVRDEYVELYNPSNTPIIVNVADNSDGWALAFSNNGTTVTSTFAVIPNGTVIPARGHLLVADNPDSSNGPTVTYSLNSYPSTQARTADSDTGWSLDLADNGGIAIFKTSLAANFNAMTRMDSAGFDGIAAGLFKEGTGIPAITAATPVGQMTFYRNLSSGTPQDTGANENDFNFVSPATEALGVTPKLGAAGPENLNSPIHFTSGGALDESLLDAGAPVNQVRDNTAVTNGAFGTITFRRTFTNNTGANLSRLRFRIVNITTNPPMVGAADLRALSSSNTTVTVSGGGMVSVGGTTLETPPTQLSGGGFNSSLSAPGITIASPLIAGASTNLQFTLGVQVKGQFNFCLIAEGDPGTASTVLCFTGSTENTPPTIAASGVTRQEGTPGANAIIANVNDGEDAKNTLNVKVNGGASATVNGVTVSNIAVNAMGVVTADVVAASGATNASFTLRVTDSGGLFAEATLNVAVLKTPPFTASLTDPIVCNGVGGSVIVTAQLTNPNAGGSVASTFTAMLPAELSALSGTCTATSGNCQVTGPGQVTWMGNLAQNQSVTISYQALVMNGTPPDQLLCINSTATVGAASAAVKACGTTSCPTNLLNNPPTNVAVSDQKPGSLLVFPYYTAKNKADTRLSLSNIGEQQAYVHLFFIDGASCQQADLFVCLTPYASIAFKVSEYDPETTGWLMAVAVNEEGLPIQQNTLIGNAFVNDGQDVDNYGAEAFWAHSSQPAIVQGNTAMLQFNNVGYDAVPDQFAVEIQSPVDASGQRIVTVGMLGDLTTGQLTGAGQVGVGLVINGNEKPTGSYSNFLTGKCQAITTISSTNPRVPGGMNQLIPSGQVGTMNFNVGAGVGLLMTPKGGAWNGIRTLHKTHDTFSTIKIPIFKPVC